MSIYDLEYLYNNDFNKGLIEAISEPRKEIGALSYVSVDNATILPGKTDPTGKLPWGIGGVIDSDDNYVEQSGIIYAFGGGYDYRKEETAVLDEEVIHINIIPKHWGHFLVDTVSRLWYILETNSECKITYCGWKLGEDGVKGNYLQFLELLGIEKKRLIYVDKPLKVRRVIIPDRSFEFIGTSNEKYKMTLDILVNNVMKERDIENHPDHIYLTRRQLKKSKFYDTGEKQIEDTFRKNGYTVIASEKLSLKEQVRLFQGAKVIAALGGTLPHNIVFSGPQTEMVILNRATDINYPQIGFNNLFDRKVTYIDVYNRIQERVLVSHGEGPFWVECNKNLVKWFENKGYPYCKKSSGNLLIYIKNCFWWNALRSIHWMRKRIK